MQLRLRERHDMRVWSTVALFMLMTTGLMGAVLYAVDAGLLPEPAVLLGIFGPALVAVLLTLGERGARTSDLLRQYTRLRASVRVYCVALFAVPLLLLLTQALMQLFPGTDYPVRYAPLAVAHWVFLPLISIGEELGWRGYLQPRLRQRYSLTVASVVVGTCWALWHLPGYYFGTGVVEGVAFPWFCLWVVSAAVIMGWLYERSQSVFIAILFHTSANASLNTILITPQHTGSDFPFRLLTALVVLLAIVLLASSRAGKRTMAQAGEQEGPASSAPGV